MSKPVDETPYERFERMRHFKVQATVLDNGNIQVNIGDEIAKYFIRMQDEAVRQALIQLGWTPPKEEPQ